MRKLPVCALWMAVVGAGCASNSASDGAVKLAACPAAPSDPVTLGVVTVDREQLFVDVTTSGCAEHTFSACWDGGIFDTDPGMIVVSLSHDAHGDTCPTLATSLVRIDLSPVFAKFAPPWIARVEIAGDPNGAFSSVFVPGT